MAVRIPSLGELLAVLNLPVSRHVPIHDRAPDPGLFGPGSVTWRVLAEPLLVVGGLRAVLMQIANPEVAAGVEQHSDFNADPFGRLLRTYDWMISVAFGTTDEARAACRGINRGHQRITGDIGPSSATATVAAAKHYQAHDRILKRWVHATLIDTLLITYEAMVRPLSRADQDRFVVEWNAVGRLVGLAGPDLFTTRRQLTEYIATEIATSAEVGPGSHRVADGLLNSPFAATRALWPAATMVSLVLLPEELQRRFGVTPTRAERRATSALLAASRLRNAIPGRVRGSAVSRFATARCRGAGERAVA